MPVGSRKGNQAKNYRTSLCPEISRSRVRVPGEASEPKAPGGHNRVFGHRIDAGSPKRIPISANSECEIGSVTQGKAGAWVPLTIAGGIVVGSAVELQR
jgi:hypothetical protein